MQNNDLLYATLKAFGFYNHENAENFLEDILKARPTWPQEVREEITATIPLVRPYFEAELRSWDKICTEDMGLSLPDDYDEVKEELGRAPLASRRH